jgi:hypothetical protein
MSKLLLRLGLITALLVCLPLIGNAQSGNTCGWGAWCYSYGYAYGNDVYGMSSIDTMYYAYVSAQAYIMDDWGYPYAQSDWWAGWGWAWASTSASVSNGWYYVYGWHTYRIEWGDASWSDWIIAGNGNCWIDYIDPPGPWQGGEEQSFSIHGGNFGVSPSVSIFGDASGLQCTPVSSEEIGCSATLSAQGGSVEVVVTLGGYNEMSFIPNPGGQSPSPGATADVQIVAVPAVPVVSGPHEVWWFGRDLNGEAYGPAGYAVSIILTSSAGAATTWRIVQGADKVTLLGTGAHTTVMSTGSALSSQYGDIQIVATAGGVDSDTFFVTSRAPQGLARQGNAHTVSDSVWGYVSFVDYVIIDTLGVPLPVDVPVNESWTSAVSEDMLGANWDLNSFVDRGQGGGLVAQNALFTDAIQGQLLEQGIFPPAFYGPNDSTAVDHWGQQWRVGSTASGRAVVVQDDTLQKYQGRADHI